MDGLQIVSQSRQLALHQLVIDQTPEGSLRLGLMGGYAFPDVLRVGPEQPFPLELAVLPLGSEIPVPGHIVQNFQTAFLILLRGQSLQHAAKVIRVTTKRFISGWFNSGFNRHSVPFHVCWP